MGTPYVGRAQRNDLVDTYFGSSTFIALARLQCIRQRRGVGRAVIGARVNLRPHSHVWAADTNLILNKRISNSGKQMNWANMTFFTPSQTTADCVPRAALTRSSFLLRVGFSCDAPRANY